MSKNNNKYNKQLNKKLRKYYIYKYKKTNNLPAKKIDKFLKYIKTKKFKVVLSIMIILITFFLGCLSIIPIIKLEDSNIKISLGDMYIEPGYKGETLFTSYTNKIIVSDNIDTSTTGEYEVNYELKYFLGTVHRTRKVYVVDEIDPVLTIIGDNPIKICPDCEIKDYEYAASDNYDGDITEKVVIEKEDTKIIYTVADSSGNEVSVIREVIIIDDEIPTITLNGASTMYVYKGGIYIEPGYVASDNCDGEITGNVTTTGTVDTAVTGENTITYSVTDKANNTTTVTRKVIVYYSPPNGYGDGKIYLTFDDGPSLSITPSLLNILREENVKATFFVTNIFPNAGYLIANIASEGHSIGLHTYSHNYPIIYSSTAAYFNDLNLISSKVKNITGIDSKIIRFAGGSSNAISRSYSIGIMSNLVFEVSNRGYIYFDWNVDSKDTLAISSAEIYNNVISQLSHTKTNVVLMHDSENKYYTLNAIRDIIRYGKSNGYTFDIITSSTPRVVHSVSN